MKKLQNQAIRNYRFHPFNLIVAPRDKRRRERREKNRTEWRTIEKHKVKNKKAKQPQRIESKWKMARDKVNEIEELKWYTLENKTKVDGRSKKRRKRDTRKTGERSSGEWHKIKYINALFLFLLRSMLLCFPFVRRLFSSIHLLGTHLVCFALLSAAFGSVFLSSLCSAIRIIWIRI